MKNRKQIQRMVGIATLVAIAVVLQLIATYMPKLPGGISPTLALIPIVVGAILYGPLGGAILGTAVGVIVIVDPQTLTFFMPHNPAATIILCLLKTGLAGFCAGWIFKLLYKKNVLLAVILASIIVPIINTSLFTLGAVLFFGDVYGGGGFSIVLATIIGIIWLNFIVEFAINSLLSPAVLRIVRIIARNYNIGISFNAGAIYSEEEMAEALNTSSVVEQEK
ncbi:MAG: energy-coupled thiamine transporter ThiT [Anaeroplasmataceae bacterium]|nr:energy-coupled thiamine transporter ThiT [Anaeroplasmataceae bacterium]